MDQEALVLQRPEKSLPPRPLQSQPLPLTAPLPITAPLPAIPLVTVQQLAVVLPPLLALISGDVPVCSRIFSEQAGIEDRGLHAIGLLHNYWVKATT